MTSGTTEREGGSAWSEVTVAAGAAVPEEAGAAAAADGSSKVAAMVRPFSPCLTTTFCSIVLSPWTKRTVRLPGSTS